MTTQVIQRIFRVLSPFLVQASFAFLSVASSVHLNMISIRSIQYILLARFNLVPNKLHDNITPIE